MSWKTFSGQVTGVKVDGDPTVPATRWYNHLWLLAFGWKKVAVFDIANAGPGARVGYRPFTGEAMLCTVPLENEMFRVRIGHEACTFFVVDKDDKEVPIHLVKVTTKDDPLFQHPLI